MRNQCSLKKDFFSFCNNMSNLDILYLRPTFYSLELLACLLRNKHRFLEIFHEKKKIERKMPSISYLDLDKIPFQIDISWLNVIMHPISNPLQIF